MNVKPLRALAALGWVPPKNEPPRISLARFGGFLWARTTLGADPVIRWWSDDGEDFAPQSVSTRALRATLGAVNEAALTAMSSGLRFTAPGFTADMRSTEEERPEPIPSGWVTLAPTDVARLVWVTRSMAGGDNRYGLSGWHVDERDGHPVAAATDGNRMNYARVDALAGVKIPANHVFPGGWWRVATRLAGKGGMRIAVMEDGKVWAAGEGWATRARLTNAEFPDYRQVVPVVWRGDLRVDAKALVGAIRRVAPIAGTVYNSTLTVTCADGALTLATRGVADLGASVVATVPSVATGAWTKKGLNAQFLADTLRDVDGEVIIRESTGAIGPVGVEVADGRKSIIMPIRLN